MVLSLFCPQLEAQKWLLIKKRFWLTGIFFVLQFMRLQGKRNRGKEEVKFLEIKGDDQLSGNQQWMTKNMTEEKQQRQSFSKVTRSARFLFCFATDCPMFLSLKCWCTP